MALTAKRSLIIISVLTLCAGAFTTCISDQAEKKTPDTSEPSPAESLQPLRQTSEDFAGAGKCQKCHKDISDHYAATSHFSTSAPATEKSIKGSFNKGKNTFTYNPDLYVAMERRDSSLYQVVYYKGEEKIALRFGLTIGSGTKGQSFGRWQDNKMFQLPLTYYSIAGQWANSPGFPNKVQFERPITARCLECHASYAGVVSAPGAQIDEFDRTKIITGITCEKCHGPASNHVQFHEQHPGEKSGKFIVNPSKLTRQQRLDLCTLCHGGRLEQKTPAFAYSAGDTLSKFFNTASLSLTGRSYMSVDVHGNQYGLMSASKCFIKSDMSCNTCHDTHANERGRKELFSTRCQSCHTGEHKQTPQLASLNAKIIKSNCVDCHMAVEPSHNIVLFTSGMEAPKAASFRSHFISVYTRETQKFIDSVKKR